MALSGFLDNFDVSLFPTAGNNVCNLVHEIARRLPMPRIMTTGAALLWALVLSLLPAAAQEDLPITVAPLTPGVPVADTITDEGFYDWWLFDGQPGDVVTVEMAADAGLAPLVGLLAPGQELVARSEDGVPDATVTLTHTLEAAGEYRIVATRTGNADGTTTGEYVLSVERIRASRPAEPDRYREVSFMCEREETENVLTLAFEDDDDGAEDIRVSAYGLDGFRAVLRTQLEFDFDPFEDEFCYRAVDGVGPGYGEGDVLQLPDEEPITISAEGVRTAFSGVNELDLIEMNLGDISDEGGRYVVAIEGMEIAPGGDRDLLEVGLGPLARDGVLYIYAISDKSTRLDPALQIIDEGRDVLYECDDAGRRDCADVPPIDGFSLEISLEDGGTITAGPFDAGLRLEPSAPEKIRVLVGGFDGRTAGNYTLLLVGEYEPRRAD